MTTLLSLFLSIYLRQKVNKLALLLMKEGSISEDSYYNFRKLLDFRKSMSMRTFKDTVKMNRCVKPILKFSYGIFKEVRHKMTEGYVSKNVENVFEELLETRY